MKHVSLPLLFLIGLILWFSPYRSTWAQTAPASGSAFCGTGNLTPAQAMAFQKQIMLAFKQKMGARKAATGITYVPIRPHIFRRNNGTGGYPLAALNEAMATTNSYFLLIGTGIQFYFAGTTPDYIDNDLFYESFSYIPPDRYTNNAMNQYYINEFAADQTKRSYAGFPANNLQSTQSVIYVHGDNSLDFKYGEYVIPHELGHNFGLYHSFGFGDGTSSTTDELVTRGAGANCETHGDFICDTPADPYGMSGAKTIIVNNCYQYDPNSTARDANGDPYNPSLSNIMSYWSSCTREFTPGQLNQIQAGLALRQTHTAYTLDAPPTAVTAPTNLTGTFSNNTIILTWQDNANNEMGYFIERSTSPTDGFVPIGGVAPDVTTFSDTKIVSQTVYYYRIRPSNTTTGSLSTNAIVLAAPPLVTGLNTSNISTYSAQLNWTSAGNGLTYDVQWRPTGTATWNTINSVQTTSYTIYGLTLNTTYEWQVKTTSGTTYSAPASFTTPCPTPTPYTSSITRTSASLNFNGVYPQTYTLQWRQQGSSNWTTVNTATSSFYSLTGLSSNTGYEWQVQATCPGTTTATSAYSSLQSFTTLSCSTPTSPFTNPVYSTAAVLRWSVPIVEATTTYTLNYRPVGQPTWTTVNSLTATAYSLTGLTTNTAYEWQIKRVCTPTESSAFTAPTTFTATCIVPFNLVSNPTASAAGLTWSIPSVPETGAYFEVLYRAIGDPNWISMGAGYYGTSLIWGSSLSGLTVGRTYEWRVRTICSSTSQSDYSPTATFTTTCTAPLASNLFVDQLSSTSAGLRWSILNDPSIRYDVRYRQVGTANWMTISNLTATASTISYSLTGLTNNTQYEWQVRSVCSETQSSTFTPGPTFTTQCTTPFAVTVDRRVISATVYWSSVAVDVRYEVRYRATGSTDWITKSNLTTSSVELLGLTGNTSYEWQVKMYCNDGASSDFSAISTFTTYSCEYPTSLYGYGLTPTSAKLTWSYLQADTESRYEARYRAVGATDWITISNLTSINLAGTYVLTGLITGTQYEWQIKTLCSPTASSPFSFSLFFSPCAAMYTIRTGNWDDPGVWSCNRVPLASDMVQIKHLVTIPSSYVAIAKQITIDAGQKLTYSSNSQLKLGL